MNFAIKHPLNYANWKSSNFQNRNMTCTKLIKVLTSFVYFGRKAAKLSTNFSENFFASHIWKYVPQFPRKNIKRSNKIFYLIQTVQHSAPDLVKWRRFYVWEEFHGYYLACSREFYRRTNLCWLYGLTFNFEKSKLFGKL